MKNNKIELISVKLMGDRTTVSEYAVSENFSIVVTSNFKGVPFKEAIYPALLSAMKRIKEK